MNAAKTNQVSWRARGLLNRLAELAEDGLVEVSAEELAAEAADGVTSVRSGLTELLEAELVEREQARDEKGRLVGWRYRIAN